MVDWEGILERDGPAVWRTACRLLGHRADAEECFQETFLSALQLWGRQAVRHPRAALVKLATARAIDRLRRRYREVSRGDEGANERLPDRGPGPPDLASGAELAEALRSALGDLPDRQAEVFCLHCLDGWSYRDIADSLELSVDAVGVLLHRARARLKETLSLSAPAEREVAP